MTRFSNIGRVRALRECPDEAGEDGARGECLSLLWSLVFTRGEDLQTWSIYLDRNLALVRACGRIFKNEFISRKAIPSTAGSVSGQIDI